MMNNKVKQVLVLLFVVSTLLIMIGSVSANTDDLNENLEASNTLNDDLSVVEVDSGADKDVSNQLTISNIDEKTNGSSQTLGESNSENVVSNYEDTTIDAKDSDNDIKADNNANDVLAVSDLRITNTVLNGINTVNVGDEVTFVINVQNFGDVYEGLYDGDQNLYFMGLNFDFDSTKLQYLRFNAETNPQNYLAPRIYDSNVMFAYNTHGAFKQYDSFEFKIIFKVLTTGFSTTAASVVFTDVKSEAQINAMDFSITNTVLNPVVDIGDLVNFEVEVKNNGGTFNNDGFVGVNFQFDPNQFEYVRYTPQANPDMPPEFDAIRDFYPPREDGKNWGFVQYAYGFGQYSGFHNGFHFKFIVTLRAKAHGELWSFAQITQLNGVNARATTNSMPPSLIINHKALTPYVNTDDIVSFEIFGRNVGSPFKGNPLVMVTVYNPEELEYVSLVPGVNPDVPGIDFSNNYGNPIVKDGEVVVFYNCDNNRFENGHCFNYTVNFKALKHGIFETHTYSHQGSSQTAIVVSSDPNFTITETPSSKTMRVGDEVAFQYVIKNEGSKYTENYFGLDVYFDADKLEFLGLNNQNPNLSLESIDYTSTHGSSNSLLGIANNDWLGADSSVGHLKLGYNSEDGFGAGSTLNFDVLFKAVDDGKLQSQSTLAWDQSKYSAMAAGVAYAGDPSLKLTKTADNEYLNMGDIVSYDIFLENNGTLTFIDKNSIMINDWYPEGLNYQGYTINPDKNGVMPILHIDNSEKGHIGITYNFEENGLTDGWEPGSTLNITLHFKIVKTGILCNFVFSEWGTSDVSSVAVEEPELNLSKKCLNSSVDLNDLVYYEIYLENTGNFSYFDHANAYGEQFLIIEDLYPEGLQYVDYKINPDKNGQMWDSNYASIEDDSANHVVTIKYKTWERWEPGSSLNLTLIFRAVELGKLTNVAHVFWNWKDWGPKESQKDIELNEEADVVVGQPTFSIDKISNFKEAKVGDTVSFSIVYSNTGNRTITGAYIKDNTYSSGLQYLDFSDKDSWTFDGKDTWYYNGKLEAGQSATLTLFFKALAAGKQSNTASAGHNINNDTLNDTDTVLIKEEVNGTADTEGSEVEPEEPDEEPDEEPSEEPTPGVKGSVAKTHPTGNPLVVLLISLLTLCFVQRKGKK